MNINCDRCGHELQELGALVFSPPYLTNQTVKYHICKDCWIPLLHYVTGYSVEVPNVI